MQLTSIVINYFYKNYDLLNFLMRKKKYEQLSIYCLVLYDMNFRDMFEDL